MFDASRTTGSARAAHRDGDRIDAKLAIYRDDIAQRTSLPAASPAAAPPMRPP